MLVKLANSLYIILNRNIQLKKTQDCILEILVTALLESIDLFIAVFDVHDYQMSGTKK